MQPFFMELRGIFSFFASVLLCYTDRQECKNARIKIINPIISMKSIARAIAFIVFVPMMHLTALCQEKDYFGEYRPAVQKATEYLQLIEAQNATVLQKAFTASSFQEKNDFLGYISAENLAWSSGLIKKYGIPGDEQTAISVWRVGDKNAEGQSASVNVSFYFKEATVPMSLLSDRICINMTMRGGVYLLDGVLLFRKSEYDAMEKIIQDIPE